MIERIYILENKKIKGIEKEKEKIENMLISCGKVVEKDPDNADLIICMGGDGTILKLIGILKEPKLIYGINYGKVGFLTNSSEKVIEKIHKILNGSFNISERMLLEVNIFRNGKLIYADKILNDFLFFRKDIRIFSIEVNIDEEKIYEFRGDGILISTPTGSTAHSFSMGGPVIYPEMECILLIPFCPYTLTTRPIIVDTNKKIEIRVDPKGEIISDGQRVYEIEKNDEIIIKICEWKAKLIIEDRFFTKLKDKFNFGIGK